MTTGLLSFVSGAHTRLESAYLQISVKDRGLMGQGIFLGEAYLPLQVYSHSHKSDQISGFCCLFPTVMCGAVLGCSVHCAICCCRTVWRRRTWTDRCGNFHSCSFLSAGPRIMVKLQTRPTLYSIDLNYNLMHLETLKI